MSELLLINASPRKNGTSAMVLSVVIEGVTKIDPLHYFAKWGFLHFNQ